MGRRPGQFDACQLALCPCGRKRARNGRRGRNAVAGRENPFGALDVSKPLRYTLIESLPLRLDALTPSSLPSSALTLFDSRARQMLEKSKFALVFVDADTAIVTTRALERRVDAPMLQIRGASIYWVQKATDARQVHTEIAANSHRYIKPEDWRGSKGLSIPAESTSEVAAGWNRSNMPLCRAETGMRVVNRYFLWALQLFCFIGYVAIVWRLNLARSRFCIGTLGVCAAVLTIATFEWTAATEGVAYGALFVLFFRSFLSRGPNVSLESATTLVRDRRVKKEEVKAEPAFDNSIDASTQGFVDFSKMPPEERRRLQGRVRPEHCVYRRASFWKDCDENNICARADDASALDAGSICALKRSRAAVGAADPGNGERADAGTVVARAAPGLCAGRRGRGERRRVLLGRS